jgi:hypothetical protein
MVELDMAADAEEAAAEALRVTMIDNLSAQAKRKKVDVYPSQILYVKLVSGDTLSMNVPFPATTIEALGKCVEDRLPAFGTANTVFRFVFQGKEYRPRGEGKQMLLSQLKMAKESTVVALLESDPKVRGKP